MPLPEIQTGRASASESMSLLARAGGNLVLGSYRWEAPAFSAFKATAAC